MRFVSLCLSAAAVLTAACESSMIHKTQRFSSDQSLVTSADVRVVHKINADNYVGGRFRPTTITCAEPSPDIAKAVSSSFDLAGSFGLGGLPSNIKPEAAAAISLARAEGMAQLTQRLATIQLLRDGLYRACEAFANGAISDTAYAILLSRLDDTMVTMLMGELAAGNFSGRLAAIGTGAGGSASASLTEATQELILNAQELAGVSGSQTEPPEDGSDPNAGENQDRNQAQDRRRESSREAAKEAFAQSLANVTQLVAAQSSGFRQNPQIAETIGTMQRKFIENINLDSMVVACVTALDTGRIEADLDEYETRLKQAETAYTLARSATNKLKRDTAKEDLDAALLKQLKSPLAIHCYNDVLPTIAKHNTKILDHVIAASLAEKQFMEARSASNALKQHAGAVYDFLDSHKIRELTHTSIQQRHAALPKELQATRELLVAANAKVAKQKEVAESDEAKAQALSGALIEPELAAKQAEGEAKSLQNEYQAAKEAAEKAEEEAKEAEKAAEGKPTEDSLRVEAKNKRELANTLAKKSTTAKAKYDTAEDESKKRRAKANEAKDTANDAAAKAQKSREELRKLEIEAGRLQGRLDALNAEAGRLGLSVS